MYRVAIYSWDKAVLDTLESLIIARYHVEVYKYVSEKEFWQHYESRSFFSDIIILDMHQSRSGISLVKRFQEITCHTKIFLTTEEGDISNNFKIESVYLLRKPVNQRELYCVMDDAIYKLQESEAQILRLYFKGRITYISYCEIVYIESDRRYILVHREGKTDKAMLKLSELTERLPKYFVRCHQSYIVNIHKILYCEGNRIVLRNGDIIAVSRSRLKKTRETINLYYGNYG